MKNEIFRKVAIISYLAKELHEAYPDKQIGKTVLQKMSYFLTREDIVEFDYSLYHYGPYSSEVESEISFAEDLGMLDVKWEMDKGYFIFVKNNEFESFIKTEERKKIENVVSKYGKFNATELSIIATAFFVKDRFRIDDKEKLVEIVASIKPQYDKNWIEKILSEGNVIN